MNPPGHLSTEALHTATLPLYVYVEGMKYPEVLTSSAQQWQFHIATDM